MTNFEQFINSKPMSYTKINLKRMPKAFKSIKSKFNIPKIIHIVGTNGKGTTGRFIADILKKNGCKVGHYTSPHISKINERFWKDGKLISDKDLDKAYKNLNSFLPKKFQKSLSYFEYTTLMNLSIYEDCHWLVLEAGLGGEFDATNVFPKKLSVFTPIGFDHQSFLGDTLEEIASTKFRSVGKVAVIAQQKYDEVYNILDKIAKERGSIIYRTSPKSGISFLQENFNTAKKSANLLGFLNIDFDISEFKTAIGRFEKVAKNITIDVGHNSLSAERVVQNMRKPFTLIYNSLDDKPYRAILKIFRPKISKVEILEIKDGRALKKEVLEKTLKDLDIPYKYFKKTSKKKEYLVFGSFKVVEEFLKRDN